MNWSGVMTHTFPPFENPAVAAAYLSFPPLMREGLLALRKLIFETAAETAGVGTLEETLKWGQPAYLPARKHGTTIRLGMANPETCALYVHCQTSLIDSYRQVFPTEFRYESTRAVLVPTNGDYAAEALQQIAAMALTYHRDKAHR